MTVIALGTFDGVHRGHQKIIRAAVSYAEKYGLEPTAITFDPHPQQLIAPERGLMLLTILSERKELLHRLGIKKVYVLRFNHLVQKLSPEEFIKKYLVSRLKAKHIFAGYDFAFGWGRTGGVINLKKLGRQYGFDVTIVSPVKYNSHLIKSKKIREELSRGDFEFGVELLGHPYQISGYVVRGKGRGKDLGFPTINLKVETDKLIPSYGVYAGWAMIGNRKFKAAINIGSRPSFGAGDALVEAHLISFSKTIYGQKVILYLEKKLRNEIHFVDIEDLKKQIKKDIAKAKDIVL